MFGRENSGAAAGGVLWAVVRFVREGGVSDRPPVEGFVGGNLMTVAVSGGGFGTGDGCRVGFPGEAGDSLCDGCGKRRTGGGGGANTGAA